MTSLPDSAPDGRCMMWWRAEQIATIDTALAAAAAGRPTLLWVEGEAGQGKSSFLAEVALRANGFHRFRTAGVEDLLGMPYGIIEQLPLPSSIEPHAIPFQVAQDVRTMIDRALHSGPVMIMVDDLQWADAESSETLAWVLQRAEGDRLLVVAASRPLRPPDHPAWRRILLRDRVDRVLLDGLRTPEARALIVAAAPGVDESAADRLAAHTAGNPLYLRALLAEHSPTELTAGDELPAPAELAESTLRRLDRLPAGAAQLIRAVAVLGSGWSPLLLAAELSGADDVAGAVDAGVSSGLLDRREQAGTVQLRIVHTVLRAAVLAGLASPERDRLHLQAAGLVTSTRAALQHRRAAAGHYDDALADDLASYATDLHARGEFREAGRHLAWASEATVDPIRREARWLDSLFEYFLVRDDDLLTHASSDISWVRDQVRRGLLAAGLAIIRRRWLDGRRLLDAVPEHELATADPTTRYRIVLLRGWCRVMTGDASSSGAVAYLTWASTAPEPDHALYGYLSFGYGQVRLALAQHGRGWQLADALPPAAETTTTDTTRLAWRGAIFALGGRFDEAIDILDEVIRRVRDGLTGFGEGVFHTYLGFACWMAGDWPRAQRLLTLARESRFGPQHPMVMASQTLVAIAQNDPEAALVAARSAREALLVAPWPPAIQLAATATVLNHRVNGSDEQRARILPELRSRFGDALTDVDLIVTPVWLVHLGLASVWSGERS